MSLETLMDARHQKNGEEISKGVTSRGTHAWMALPGRFNPTVLTRRKSELELSKVQDIWWSENDGDDIQGAVSDEMVVDYWQAVV